MLNRFRLETLLYWLSPFAIVILGFLLYFTWMERWLYLRLAPATAVEKMYRQLYRWGRPLAGERTQAETAYEFMGKLIDAIDLIRERSRLTKYLARAPQAIESFTDLYQNTLFAHHKVDEYDVRKALTTWKQLRLQLMLARFHISVRRALAPMATAPKPGAVQKASDFLQKVSSA